MEVVKPTRHVSRGRLAAYLAGFALSVILTLGAYFAVKNGLLSGRALTFMVAGLAVTQLFVQLVFFLHFGKEGQPRWNLVIFAFMLLIVGIIVAGSLWIMHNLDYNMMYMPEDETEMYMSEHEGI